MNSSSLSRRALWMVILAFAAIGTPVAGILFSYSSQRPPTWEENDNKDATAATPTPGVVCFGQVDLEHGVTALYPLQPGRVEKVLVEEGQTVPEGTILLRLADAALQSRVAEAQAALAGARLRLDQARKMPEQHQSRIAQQQDAVQAMRYRLSAARHQLARKEQLLEKQIIHSLDVAVCKDQVHELEALLDVEQRRLTNLKTQDPLNEQRLAEQEVAVMASRLHAANLALDECTLKAPRRGTVLRLLVGPGDVLTGQPKQPAIQFAIDGPLVVRAEVEQEFAGRIVIGQAVLVRDEANSNYAWHGKVERVSQWITQRRSVMQEPFEFNDVRTVEALITLDPGQLPLRIGQRVRVFIGAVQS